MKRVSIRTLRAQLKAHIDAGKPVAIGTNWQVRAILIPIPPYNTYEKDSAKPVIKATLDTITKSLTPKALEWQQTE